jgi:hypothetical protein
MFLDLVQARTPFANVRAQGVDPVNGYAFARNSPTGVGGLYMRTSNVIPGAVGGPNQRVDANAAPFFPFFVGAANQNNALVGGIQQRSWRRAPGRERAALAGQIVTNLAAARPTAAQVGTVLRAFNPTSAAATPSVPFPRVVDPSFAAGEAPLRPNFVNNYEAGYKGIFADKLRLAVDGWYQERFNFITPAQLISPTVFADPATLGAYIARRSRRPRRRRSARPAPPRSAPAWRRPSSRRSRRCRSATSCPRGAASSATTSSSPTATSTRRSSCGGATSRSTTC